MKFEIFKRNSKVEAKVALVERLILGLDDLYEDLTYENDEKEVTCINSKIKIREDMLKQIGPL